MKRKRLLNGLMVFIMLLCFVFLSGCSESTKSIDIPLVIENTYVYDGGNILDDSTVEKVNKLLVELESKTDAEVAVVTVPGLKGYSIESYANELFNTLGIGKKSEDNGVLLLVSKDEKRVRLEIGRGFESLLTDSISGRILDDYFVPHRSEGDYNTATDQTVQAVCKYIADERGITLSNISVEINEKSVTEDNASGVEIILIIILVIIIAAVALALLDKGSNGRSSGGSSGDSFSGGSSFGGGFSGGGGASR